MGFRVGERDEGGGGVEPPIVMAETYPERWRERRRLWS